MSRLKINLSKRQVQAITQSVEKGNTIHDVTNSNYTIMLGCLERGNLLFIHTFDLWRYTQKI